MLANWELACSTVETDCFSLLCDDDYLLPLVKSRQLLGRIHQYLL